jgi:predicted aspartyl protease
MPTRAGTIKFGHPFVEITVSVDGKTGTKYEALIDTGYGGFVSLPIVAASTLGLRAHTTTRYTLANGKQSGPVPLAHGYACIEGDPFVKGLVAFSENSFPAVGMEFLTQCGHLLLLSSTGIALANEKEVLAAINEAQEAAKEATKAASDLTEKTKSKSA